MSDPGAVTSLDDDPQHKVKRIVVRPGKRLSYQRHARRAEHWSSSRRRDGDADGQPVAVGPAAAVDVLVGVAHRIENTGGEDLVFIEVQLGEYFGEDDIVRLEDDFGRA